MRHHSQRNYFTYIHYNIKRADSKYMGSTYQLVANNVLK